MEEPTREQMTDAADAYCKHVRRTIAMRNRRTMDLQEAFEAVDGLKAIRYDLEVRGFGMRHGDDRMAEAIGRVERSRDNLAFAVVEADAEVEEFNRCLDHMETQTYADILRLRYIEDAEWSDVAREVPYTYTHLCGYARQAALRELYDAMPERWRIRD